MRVFDALSIKATYGPNSFSQRGLAHEVLVPAAVDYGFSLRTTGREPLNNQPFFRYDHMSLIDRTGNVQDLDRLREALGILNGGSQADAAAALAAFLRVAFEEANKIADLLPPADFAADADKLRDALDTFVGETDERPRRVQATVAAMLDMIYYNVGTRKINDPSRDFPGDVQAYEAGRPIMATEVRGKPVRQTEVRAFVVALRAAGIRRGFVVVLCPDHSSLPRDLVPWAWQEHRVVLTIVESMAALLGSVLAWSSVAIETILRQLPQRVSSRLAEIEASPTSQERWLELLGLGEDSGAP